MRQNVASAIDWKSKFGVVAVRVLLQFLTLIWCRSSFVRMHRAITFRSIQKDKKSAAILAIRSDLVL